MDRPGRFEHNQYVGDKRSQVVLRRRCTRRGARAPDRRVDVGRDLPLLRSGHAAGGPQPRVPALLRATHGRQPTRSGPPPMPLDGARSRSTGHGLHVPVRQPGAEWASVPAGHGPARHARTGAVPRVPDPGPGGAPIGEVVPGARRPDRRGDGLGRPDHELPGLRSGPGRLLAHRMVGRRPRRGPPCRHARRLGRVVVWIRHRGLAGAVRRGPQPLGARAWRPWRRRPTSTTGPVIPAGCWCTPVRSA